MNIFTLHLCSTGNVYIHPTANIDPTATVSIFPNRPLVLHHEYTQMAHVMHQQGKSNTCMFFLSQSSWVPTSPLALEWLSVLESEFESPSSSMVQLSRWAAVKTVSWLVASLFFWARRWQELIMLFSTDCHINKRTTPLKISTIFIRIRISLFVPQTGHFCHSSQRTVILQ